MRMRAYRAVAATAWRRSQVLHPIWCLKALPNTILIAGAAASVAGCSTSRDPSFQTGSQFPLIEYRLPQTSVQAKIPLTLTACGRSSLAVEGDFSLEAEARASNAAFAVTPAVLESARVKRGLEVKLHDTGAIASINSDNS